MPAGDVLAQGFIELSLDDMRLKDDLAAVQRNIDRGITSTLKRTQMTAAEMGKLRDVTNVFGNTDFGAVRLKETLGVTGRLGAAARFAGRAQADFGRSTALSLATYRQLYGTVAGTVRYLRESVALRKQDGAEAAGAERSAGRFRAPSTLSSLLLGGAAAGLLTASARAAGPSVSDTLTGSFRLLGLTITRPLIPTILSWSNTMQQASRRMSEFQKEHPGLSNAAGNAASIAITSMAGLAAIGLGKAGFGAIRSGAGVVGRGAATMGGLMGLDVAAGAAAGGALIKQGIGWGLRMAARIAPWAAGTMLVYEGVQAFRGKARGDKEGQKQASDFAYEVASGLGTGWLLRKQDDQRNRPLLPGAPVASGIYDPSSLRDAALMASLGASPLDAQAFREELANYRILAESADKMAAAADNLNQAAGRMGGNVPMPPGN